MRHRRLASSIYLLALLVGAAWLTWQNREQVLAAAESARLGVMIVALIASPLTLLPQAGLWGRALRSMGNGTTNREVLAATVEALPSRYLPGGIWYAVGRAAVLSKRGSTMGALSATAIVELGITVAVALTVGSSLVALANQGGPQTTALIGAALIIAMLVGLPVLNRGIAYVAERRGSPLPVPMGRPTLTILMGWNLAFWATSGLVFWLVAAGMGLDTPALATVGSYMVAWGVGVLAPFAPQGLGVFEVSLAGLLRAGAVEVVLVAVMFRLVMLVRDLLLTVGVHILRRRAPRNA